MKNDLVGKTFGRLKVIANGGLDSFRKNSVWVCLCSCGEEIKVPRPSLLQGYTKSCGCLRLEICSEKATTHGDSKTRLYKTWCGIKERCFNKTNIKYKYYGGRGIKMNPKWQDYISFKRWALSNGYQEDLTIDRIDNNGDYSPLNCRWSTRKEQANNRRSNVVVDFRGITDNLSGWSHRLNIPYKRLQKRHAKWGVVPEKLFREVL